VSRKRRSGMITHVWKGLKKKAKGGGGPKEFTEVGTGIQVKKMEKKRCNRCS